MGTESTWRMFMPDPWQVRFFSLHFLNETPRVDFILEWPDWLRTLLGPCFDLDGNGVLRLFGAMWSSEDLFVPGGKDCFEKIEVLFEFVAMGTGFMGIFN